MSSTDDFVHILSGPNPSPSHPGWSTTQELLNNCKADRQFTEGLIYDALVAKYPHHHVAVVPGYPTDFLAFGSASQDVTFSPHKEIGLIERSFLPPARRYNDENGGNFADTVIFGMFDYQYKTNQFLVYIADCQDGMYKKKFSYVLYEYKDSTEKIFAQQITDELIAAAAKYAQELHNEVLVFDQGFWQKNKELYENIQKSNWEDVILEQEKKEAIIEDVLGFFNAESRYAEFGVPWKRGVIFYGPPGNGKTISTKALMHDISKRTSPKIESLYVKTFNSFAGPEYGIRQIFMQARRLAPCLLIFEDIDSLILPNVRSYFLNEVDGLESNHGILMIGSTNHLERLDPGIAKRPSRFDRKYLFDVPNREERIQYCDYWRHKLRNNKKVDFPKVMSEKVAEITSDFSFAYMKEAFVAALLVIVARSDEKSRLRRREDDLSGNVLWKELYKQIESLRREMDGDDDEDAVSSASMTVGMTGGMSMTGMWPALGGVLDERRPSPLDFPLLNRNNGMPRYY
ncbi:P-loop containing nucleoside triphosphate hydrolase protein [Mollisia scopiformis]|uniref:p-loop containing nucleoside triphosphate hydrolase protein n=1 Tax=Mollisia scopiformis TaxID=149040 RepID=A0A132B6G4_MOLSC|nr:P-loop containing nucleoside triphosphate hydrolase protein [Mollisia scopiformis]KUJ07990.1 P-loop containing nucleoside triphosphate hydrolase protein [Mollisia scopiformis]